MTGRDRVPSLCVAVARLPEKLLLYPERCGTGMANLLILGVGGFGRTVREMAISMGKWDRILCLDDASQAEHVIGKCDDYHLFLQDFEEAYPAFGDNSFRLEWVDKLKEAGYRVPTIIHPTAFVSPSVQMGDGVIVMQHAVINTGTVIGRAALINCGAIIDHDNQVGEGAHIGLGTIVKAWNRIPPCQKVEAGRVLMSPRRKIDGVDNLNLEDAIYAFPFHEQCSFVKPFGSGHINDTYALFFENQNEEVPKYILQRLNTNVFKNPAEVMQNIFGVTAYLRRQILTNGGDSERETLNYLKTKAGKNFFIDTDGQPWRCYRFVPHSFCYQQAESPEQFYHSAVAFGNFLRQLGDYPAGTLYETIPRFHDTRSRFADFKKAVSRDIRDRKRKCLPEVEFMLAHEKDCAVLMDLLEQGKLPLRVTHNDTKLNNVLFDETTGQALCVIDLDTIMPGLALNDFGDAIRFGASTAAEDEPDLSKVHFDLTLYEAFTRGYLEAAGDVLTDTEKSYLPWGAKLMTLECGMRFLTDYLNGDTYFKVDHASHNLERCRTHVRLVSEMEQHWDEMNDIVRRYSNFV